MGGTLFCKCEKVPAFRVTGQLLDLSLLLEPSCQPRLQRRHRLGERLGQAVLKVDSSVPDRPGYEAEALLIADLDVAVASDVPGDRRKQSFDARLFVGGLEHADPLLVPLPPKVSLRSLLDGRQLPLD